MNPAHSKAYVEGRAAGLAFFTQKLSHSAAGEIFTLFAQWRASKHRDEYFAGYYSVRDEVKGVIAGALK